MFIKINVIKKGKYDYICLSFLKQQYETKKLTLVIFGGFDFYAIF
jgi:hypothetical protein